jgi:hypothetical protein
MADYIVMVTPTGTYQRGQIITQAQHDALTVPQQAQTVDTRGDYAPPRYSCLKNFKATTGSPYLFGDIIRAATYASLAAGDKAYFSIEQ